MPEHAYTVFARRCRPAAFDEVVGQEHVAVTLRNAISENRMGHAYLFSGPRGVGKTSMARIFAQAINCGDAPTPTPCGTCESCRLIHEGNDSDVIEMDAASNRGVDDARSLRDGVRYAPLRSRNKIYIIDEAHMLTREAFNTLLKTLEEPPPHVRFILATTEIHTFPDTITSRCQRFEFRRITTGDIVRRLEQITTGEGIDLDPSVLLAVARAGRGSMRDAQSFLDQLVAFKEKGHTREDLAALLGTAGGEDIREFVSAISKADPAAVMETLDRIYTAGADGTALLDQILETFRTLLVLNTCGKDAPMVDLPDHEREETAELANRFTSEALLYALQLCLDARRRVREGAEDRIVLEITGVRLARLGDLVSIAEAVKTLEQAPLRTARAASSPATEPAPSRTASSTPRAAGPETRKEQRWNLVVQKAREKSILAATLLSEGRISGIDDEALRFLLPSKFKKFHLDQLKDAKHRTPIEEAIAKIYGRPLRFEPELEGGAAPEPAARPEPDRSEEMTTDPGVRRILDTFPGSKIVGIE